MCIHIQNVGKPTNLKGWLLGWHSGSDSQSERSSSLDILSQTASEGPGKTFCGTGMSMNLSASEDPSKTFGGISMSRDQSASEGSGKTFCGTGTFQFGLPTCP